MGSLFSKKSGDTPPADAAAAAPAPAAADAAPGGGGGGVVASEDHKTYATHAFVFLSPCSRFIDAMRLRVVAVFP